MAVTQRDPLALAAARVMQAEGIATKPCEVCFREGRPLVPPEVYVARALEGRDAGKCWIVYSCPSCNHGSTVEIPQHLLLAAPVRRDPVAVERAAEAEPSLFYEVDGMGRVAFKVDPADGGDPLQLAVGDENAAGVRRARAAFDYLTGGNARRRVGR